MSQFWDRIKPSVPAPVVVDLSVSADARVLSLVWEDGEKTSTTAQTLRRNCPCASCVDEWTHQRTLDPKKIAEDLTFEAVNQVGNYALGITFADTHSTGIFPWKLLREVSQKLPSSPG